MTSPASTNFRDSGIGKALCRSRSIFRSCYRTIRNGCQSGPKTGRASQPGISSHNLQAGINLNNHATPQVTKNGRSLSGNTLVGSSNPSPNGGNLENPPEGVIEQENNSQTSSGAVPEEQALLHSSASLPPTKSTEQTLVNTQAPAKLRVSVISKKAPQPHPKEKRWFRRIVTTDNPNVTEIMSSSEQPRKKVGSWLDKDGSKFIPLQPTREPQNTFLAGSDSQRNEGEVKARPELPAYSSQISSPQTDWPRNRDLGNAKTVIFYVNPQTIPQQVSLSRNTGEHEVVTSPELPANTPQTKSSSNRDEKEVIISPKLPGISPPNNSPRNSDEEVEIRPGPSGTSSRTNMLSNRGEALTTITELLSSQTTSPKTSMESYEPVQLGPAFDPSSNKGFF